MEIKIQEYSICQCGQRTDKSGRPLQEDSIFPALGHANPDDRIFIVCDGMGGPGYGALASSTVCDAVSRYLSQLDQWTYSRGDVLQAISYGYNALDRVSNADNAKMGTTLAMLVLSEHGCISAHMGDSRVYHIRPAEGPESTRILWRTDDHTLVNHLVKKGEMTPEEALTSPKRHVITRAMQPNMQRRCMPDIYESADVRAGDYFFLCTDGMLENLTDENICAIFSNEGGSAKNKTALLTKYTQDNADNHSAIIVYIAEIDGATPAIPKQKHSREIADSPKPKNTETMNKRESKPVTEGVRNFVNKHTANADTTSLVIKFVLVLMGVLALIMIIYYLFIRTDETLQTAGTRIDPVNTEETEVYGYEITEQDIRNEAQPVMPEIEVPTDDEIITYEIDDESLPKEEDTAPDAPSDEPILQE